MEVDWLSQDFAEVILNTRYIMEVGLMNMSTRKNYSFDNSQEVGTTRFTITTTCIIIYLNTNPT